MWVRLCLLCDSALLSVLLSLTNKWEENQQWEGNERRPPMGGKSRLKPRAASTCLLYYEYYEVNHDFWPRFGGKNFPSCLSFSASQLFLLLNSSFHSLWCGRKACAGSLKKNKKNLLNIFVGWHHSPLIPHAPLPSLFPSSPFLSPTESFCETAGRPPACPGCHNRVWFTLQGEYNTSVSGVGVHSLGARRIMACLCVCADPQCKQMSLCFEVKSLILTHLLL